MAQGRPRRQRSHRPPRRPKPNLQKKPAAAKKKASKPDAGTPSKASAPTAGEPQSGADEKEPELLKKARGGNPDNLKMLKGVGPKLEATLNELGIFHFDQVASWGPQEITWVDSRLKFKGRIERDGWIEQAKTLASGGETEFSKRVEAGDVASSKSEE
ncbi:hypothetical protein OKA06_20330 [Novosphingobium sp. MW5]|nr:hypothetical protein [Novosphingobium sp. MW5]